VARSKSISVPVTGNTAPLRKSLKDSELQLNLFGKKVAVNAKRAAQATGAALVTIGYATKKAIEAASDLNETIAKTGEVFGTSSDEILAWSKTASSAFGQTRRQALDAASTFATFGKAAGMSGIELTDFAKSLTVLSSDLASFYNTSPEDAIQAIGAALRGESEPIRRYGVLLNDAALKQRAMAMGISDGTGTLTAQQKVMAAYSEILAQTSDAQGDFSRTADGLANSSRTLKSNIADLTAELGQRALPTVELYTSAAVKLTEELKKADEQQISSTAKNVKFSQSFIDKIIPGVMGAKQALKLLNGAVRDYVEQAGPAKTITEQWADSMIALERADLRSQMKAAQAARRAAFEEGKRQEEASKKAQEAAIERAKRLAAAYKDLKNRIADAKDAVRDYVAGIRDQINTEVSLSSAFAKAEDEQEAKTAAVTAALEERREAYAALNEAKATKNRQAFAEATERLARAEAAVTAAQDIKPKDYSAIFAEQIAAAKNFASLIPQLIGAGLGKAGLAQILDLGPIAGAQVAKDLLAGTGGLTVGGLNQDLASITAAGTAAGMAMPGFAAALGATVGGTAAAPTIIVNAGVGDPVQIGKEVAAVLNTYGAKTGGVPVVMKKPKAKAGSKPNKRNKTTSG